MANFEKSLSYVLQNEGGYTNDPFDHGGATNYGITQHDLSRYLGKSASPNDVKNMTMEQAQAIYRQQYWNPLHLDYVQHDGLATAIFDCCVLRGIGFIREVQGMVHVATDGHVGPITLEALNNAHVGDVIEDIIYNCQHFYYGIVAHNPTQARFLKGWLGRANRLKKLMPSQAV